MPAAWSHYVKQQFDDTATLRALTQQTKQTEKAPPPPPKEIEIKKQKQNRPSK